MSDRGYRNRSVFWPIVLIVLGGYWLLGNLGLIQQIYIWDVLRLWPLLLIAMGLNLLVGRRSSILSGLIALLAVAAAVALLALGPQLGWTTTSAELKSEIFSEPLGDATSSNVFLDLSSAPVTIFALDDSSNLVEADLDYTGEIDFNVSGTQHKQVRLSRRAEIQGPFISVDLFDAPQKWDIGLSPQVPVDLEIDIGSGTASMNLSALQITDLVVDGGSGSARVTMPTSGAFNAVFDTGSGSVKVTFPAEVDVELALDSGSGSVVFEVPASAAVQVDVRDSGSGSIRVPDSFTQVQSGEDDEGVWETTGFASAAVQIRIVVEDMGSGSLTIR